MILANFDDFAQARFKFSTSAPRQAALKHGKLEPLPETAHGLENSAPTAVVGDVVGYDVRAFIAHLGWAFILEDNADSWVVRLEDGGKVDALGEEKVDEC